MTRGDRPAGFGRGRSWWLFAVHAVLVAVSHPRKSGGRDEPREDVGSLTTTVAGWWCGLRFGQAREWLLSETGRRCEDGAV
ncbi:MAG: hypothetical protein ABIQ18_26485 [Umezawaea sp.]